MNENFKDAWKEVLIMYCVPHTPAHGKQFLSTF